MYNMYIFNYIGVYIYMCSIYWQNNCSEGFTFLLDAIYSTLIINLSLFFNAWRLLYHWIKSKSKSSLLALGIGTAPQLFLTVRGEHESCDGWSKLRKSASLKTLVLGKINQKNLINVIVQQKKFKNMKTISKIKIIAVFSCVPKNNNVNT